MSDKDRSILDYEHNINMHYEAKRKELDILLTSSMPQQLSTMKTLLWINIIMMGAILHFVEKFPLPDSIIGFLFLSLCGVLSVMGAILIGRTKSYGVPDDVLYMHHYKDNEWTISQATTDLLKMAAVAIEENRKVLVSRAKLMHLATVFTTVSILFIVISFFLKHINL